MKLIDRILCFVMAITCSALIIPSFCTAALSSGNHDRYIEDIIAYKSALAQVESEQALADSLAGEAGTGAEWFVFGLSAYNPALDFSGYTSALTAYLESNPQTGVSALKYALVLTELGAEPELCMRLAEAGVGKAGLMSLVYGLHLATAGVRLDNFQPEALIEGIISFRNSDGGFSVTGSISDADVTAMTVQALAPYVDINVAASDTVEGALALLSGMQLESGGFSSYGFENAESIAQVILVLSVLGRDPETDGSFIKNGNTLLSALESYEADGGFIHKEGGGISETATSQVLYALVSLKLSRVSGDSVFVRGDTSQASETSAETGSTSGADPAESGIRIPAVIFAVLTVAAAIILYLFKVRKKVVLVPLALICAAFVLLAVIPEANGAEKPEAGTLTISVRCDSVIGAADFVPLSGEILPSTNAVIYEGDTVYSVLARELKRQGIPLRKTGGSTFSDETVYISGIAGISEKDFGDQSGWIYYINGESPSFGCGSCPVSDGDSIEWVYTVTSYTSELGKTADNAS